MYSVPDDERRRAAEADRAWQRGDLKLLCELYAEQIEADARSVALDFRLPWSLRELRECGKRSVYELAKNPRIKRLDWSFSRAAPTYIPNKIRERGKALRAQEEAQDGDRELPTDEQIKDALETFSVEGWKDLTAEFGYKEAWKLGSYLEAHREEHEYSPERIKYARVDAYARERRIVLTLSQPKVKFIGITDPLWDARWQSVSRAKNLEGAPRPSKRRSWSEMVSERAIAEALSEPGYTVTPYQVKKWRERREREPFEEFDGDINDYLLKMRDSAAYERLRRQREQDEE